jgi:hypothetical protein
LTLVLIALSSCQTTRTSLILAPSSLETERSTARNLLYWNFGDPKVGLWERFNATYESRHLGGVSNQPNEEISVSTENPGTNPSDSKSTPPGYSDLLKDSTYASEYVWKSSEHVILIDTNARTKLKAILDVLEIEISLLEDNIANLKKANGVVQFIASKPILGNGRVVRVEHVSSTPSVEAMVSGLKQDVLDYNSILAALGHAGYLYLGLERIVVPSEMGLR